MSKFWSPIVSRLTPYTPGEQPKIANLVKLNTNENPYGPSPRAIDAIAREVGESLRLYPNPDAEPLKLAIASRHAGDGITAREGTQRDHPIHDVVGLQAARRAR